MQTTLISQKCTPFKGLFLLVCVGVIVLAVGYAISHGPERHPGEAEQVRQCLNQNGTLQVWMNPDTGRLANVCQVGPSLFGIQIIQKAKEGWDEITGFTKPKMKRLEQVMQYLRNTGYILLR